MSVLAKCPDCSTSASVPDEMVGKKVRCKNCESVFVVKSAPAKAEKASAGKSRPGSSVNVGSKSNSRRPINKPVLTSHGRKASKGISPLIWIGVAVLLLVVAGGVGVGVMMSITEEPKHARNTKPKHDPVDDPKPAEKPAKDVTAKASPRPEPTAKNVPRPAPAPKAEVKSVEPTVLAALGGSSPVEIKDIPSIKAVFGIRDDPSRIGIHSRVDNENFFEMYDLKRGERVAKVKLPDGVSLIDVDNAGTAVATTSSDGVFGGGGQRINVYSLPDGGLIADDRNSYDNGRDKIRHLGELGGKISSIVMLNKDEYLVMSNLGLGDVWPVAQEKSKILFQRPQRSTFRKEELEANRDYALNPARSAMAIATDEGIEFRDLSADKVLGSTRPLTKYGTKPDIAGMGFDPAGKSLAVWFSAAVGDGRSNFLIRFAVPSGDEISKQPLGDPGLTGGLEFVNDDHFLMFDRNHALLRDVSGRTIAECDLAGRSTLFSPRPVQSAVAFSFVNAKNQPAVGLVTMPIAGARLASLPPPRPKAVEPAKDAKPAAKGSGLDALFASPDPPAMAEPATPKGAAPRPAPIATEQTEIWEFGPQGIVRRGVRAVEVRAAQ